MASEPVSALEGGMQLLYEIMEVGNIRLGQLCSHSGESQRIDQVYFKPVNTCQ